MSVLHQNIRLGWEHLPTNQSIAPKCNLVQKGLLDWPREIKTDKMDFKSQSTF